MAIFLLTLLVGIIPSILAADKLSGVGATGLYWDCCKPSCAWSDKGPFSTHPVQTCNKDDSPLKDQTAGSACGQGGTAFVCNNQQPWVVNDTFSYGFTSTFIVGASESDWCCSCYELNFINGAIKGKRMVVQASNTGYDDPTRNIFGVGVPGARDYASACLNRYDGAGDGFLGQNGTLITSRDECKDLPQPLQQGCLWRFDWFHIDLFKGATRPNMTFTRIKCPKVLTDITGCIRSDEQTFNTTSGSRSSSFTESGSISLLTISLIFAVWTLCFTL
ncbi:Endoglucanase-5 [Arthrobotrys entomopaga]|nr:Endoglucanase-5 [Arthrobotrys entomopaga]